MIKYEEFKLSSPLLQPEGGSGPRLVLPPPRPHIGAQPPQPPQQFAGLQATCLGIRNQPLPPPRPVVVPMRPKLIIPYIMPASAASSAVSNESSGAPSGSGEWKNPYVMAGDFSSCTPCAMPRPSRSAALVKKDDAVTVAEPPHEDEYEDVIVEEEEVSSLEVRPRHPRRPLKKWLKKKKHQKKTSKRSRKRQGRWNKRGGWRKWRNW